MKGASDTIYRLLMDHTVPLFTKISSQIAQKVDLLKTFQYIKWNDALQWGTPTAYEVFQNISYMHNEDQIRFTKHLQGTH